MLFNYFKKGKKFILPIKRPIFKNKNAVSVVVSTVLTLMIIVAAVATIMFWAIPYLDQKKLEVQSRTASNSLVISSDLVKSLIINGEGSSGLSNINLNNDQGSYQIKKYNDRIIISYSFSNKTDYNFTINGFDMEEIENFEIKFKNHSLDKLELYSLDPEKYEKEELQQYSYSENIYYGNCFAQSFTPDTSGTDTTRVLKNISINISKRGDLPDLNVSIFQKNGDSLGVFKTKKTISSDLINNEPTWLTVDFTDKPENTRTLDISSTYLVVLNCSGGCYNYSSSCYNYYSWQPFDKSPYENSMPYYCSADISGIEIYGLYDEKYDFPCRIYYEDSNIPSIPNLEHPKKEVSGIELLYNITSLSPDDPYVYYKIYWGDNTNTDWLQSNSTYVLALNKIWNSSGDYKVRIQCKSKYDNLTTIDNITTINVETGNEIPKDFDEDTDFYSATYSMSDPSYDSISGIYTYDINPDIDLSQTLRIDLFNDSFLNDTLLEGKLPFGRIWVFDLGASEIKLPYSIGTQTISFENGCVISKGPNGNSFKNDPLIYEEDKSIAFRVIQLDKYSSGGGGGNINTKMKLTNVNGFNREPGFQNIYNFKLNIYGENQELWIEYLKRNYDFKAPDIDNSNLIYHNFNQSKKLILYNSFINIEMGGY